MENKRTELLSRSNIWSTEQDCPIAVTFVNYYSIVALKNSFYIFGGEVGPLIFTATNEIARFSTVTKQWKKLGMMNSYRYGHGVYVQRDEFVVLGGADSSFSPAGTERCKLNGDSINCTTVDPKLNMYIYYPETARVPADYCPK